MNHATNSGGAITNEEHTPLRPLRSLNPFTEGEQAVWDALEGVLATAPDLAGRLGKSAQMVTNHVASIRAKRGKGIVRNWHKRGYFRPDALPSDTDVPPEIIEDHDP